MRIYLLAAAAAVALLATGPADTLAQRSNDRNQRWMGVINDSKFDVYSITMIPNKRDCCWSRNLLGKEKLPKKKKRRDEKDDKEQTMLLDFDDGSGGCVFDILASGNRHWYFPGINVCQEVQLTLKDSSGDGGNRKRTVKNTSGAIAALVFAIPSGRECCWSRDLLGSKIIPPKEPAIIDFDDGYNRNEFDILVRGTKRSWYFERIDVRDKDELVLKASSDKSKDRQERKMTLFNDSELVAKYAYAIPSGQDCCWSRDLFGSDVIQPEGSLLVSFDDGYGTCTFDILVRGGPGKERRLTRDWHFEKFNVCNQTELRLFSSSYDGQDREITVQNNSNLIANQVYAIRSGRDCCWSVLLGKDAIPPGGSSSVNLDDGSGECTFDIRVTSDGPGLEWNFDRVDVCHLDRLKRDERTFTLK